MKTTLRQTLLATLICSLGAFATMTSTATYAASPTWVAMTKALVQSENVHIIAYNATEKTRIQNLLLNAGVPLASVSFLISPTEIP